MFRVINEYTEKINLCSNEEIYGRIVEFVTKCKNIYKFSVTVNFNRYVVDIKLNKYSVDAAKNIFDSFNKELSYPYSSLHVRFNEGSCVRYRYITCKENKDGFYCDIVIG